MARVVANLSVGESQDSEAGGDQRLIPDPILCLLSWRPVIPQTIRLDDQPGLWPEEVQAVSVHALLSLRPWQPRLPNKPQELTLQL